ncbi:uncharacterized protein J8A68_004407 [[Candida] subhashii]|uniref:LIM zinc-binding domain-containing protein n=1 Tax=[Candida] subhashii TaxID=561895 RepID=A0A8J5QK57_9ASCO|nr:uncharacterized protein J8A68_004407 [[Candida] subhashii]KAG7662145.1 hypothetical protein J8A68_004407 [[Candida] subhashii]
MMSSFPTYLRNNQQPTRPIDSAFPPFKIEHKYKGVYERAGFDVFKDGTTANNNNNNQDNYSMRSSNTGNKSMHSKSQDEFKQQQHQQQYLQQQQHTYQQPKSSSSSASFSSSSNQSSSSPFSSKFNLHKSTSTVYTTNRPQEQIDASRSSSSNIRQPTPTSSSMPYQQQQNYRSVSESHLHQQPYHQQQQPSFLHQEQRSMSYGNHQQPAYAYTNHHQQQQAYAQPQQPQQQQQAYAQPQQPQQQQQPYRSIPEDSESTFDFGLPQPTTFNNSKNIKKLTLDLDNNSNSTLEAKSISDTTSTNASQNWSQADKYPQSGYQQTPTSAGSSSHSHQSKRLTGQSYSGHVHQYHQPQPPQPHRRYSPASPASAHSSGNIMSIPNSPSAYLPNHHPLKMASSPNLSLHASSGKLPASPTNPDLQGVSRDDKLSHALNQFRADVEQSHQQQQQVQQQQQQQQQQQYQRHHEPQVRQYQETYMEQPAYTSPDRQTSESPEQVYDPNKLIMPTQQSNFRNSQLSMVSSIISKGGSSSRSNSPSGGESEGDDKYDEDAEIEKELERQLMSLKMSGQDGEDGEGFTDDERKLVGAGVVPLLPSFNIQDMSEVELPVVNGHEEEVEEELTQPLSIRSKSVELAREEQEEEERSAEEEVEDESIHPLSPKTHIIDQELKNMNFEITTTDKSPSDFLNKEKFDSTPTPIIPHEPTHHIDNLPDETPLSPIIYPAGQGPCRACHLPILAGSHGSDKAIYSKSGDLSGQWHRRCFRCSHPNCNTQFTKSVAVYVLADMPYCYEHYHELNGSRCEECMIGIEGECIENELGQRWHLGCLKCWNCRGRIRGDYWVVDGEICCEEDAKILVLDREREGGGVDKMVRRRTRIFNME